MRRVLWYINNSHNQKETKKMNKNDRLVAGVFAIALGVMFITAQNKVIQITLSVLGAALLIMALIDFVGKETVKGVFKAVAGVCVIVFGWIFVDLALYLIAALLLLCGIFQLILVFKLKALGLPTFNKILAFAKPVATLVAGAFLLFNKDGALSWIFVLSGVLITVEGILLLVDKTGSND